MFDKVTIEAVVSDDACAHLAHKHSLWTTVDNSGAVVRYATSMVSRINGVDMRVNVTPKGNVVTLKASLHKYWNLRTKGELRNNDLFTMSEAKAAFRDFLFEYGLLPENVWIKQFEIGLNLDVSSDPLTFIEIATTVGCSTDKQMFTDANFRINRQKTTEKSRFMRRYFKIYDKSYEMQEKKRGKDRLTSAGGPFVLRIETVYRRHREKGNTLFSDANLNRLAHRFYVDWNNLFFAKEIAAHKGAKKSEVERAKLLVNLGEDNYMESVRKEYETGRMTDKQFRTIREFIRDYEANKDRYKVVISPQEREFKRLLMQQYTKAKM